MSFQVGDVVRSKEKCNAGGYRGGHSKPTVAHAEYTVVQVGIEGSQVQLANDFGVHPESEFELVREQKEIKMKKQVVVDSREGLEVGDVIAAKPIRPYFDFLVEREVPFELPTKQNAVVMVKTAEFATNYVWIRSWYQPGKWYQSGAGMGQADEQLLLEANKHGNLTVLYEGDS